MKWVRGESHWHRDMRWWSVCVAAFLDEWLHFPIAAASSVFSALKPVAEGGDIFMSQYEWVGHYILLVRALLCFFVLNADAPWRPCSGDGTHRTLHSLKRVAVKWRETQAVLWPCWQWNIITLTLRGNPGLYFDLTQKYPRKDLLKKG